MPERAFLRVSGADATRWLNGMVTNSTQALEPGAGNYNFLLNAQGRIQGDATIFREPGDGASRFLLETDASQLETIQTMLDRFIIMDDVELVRVEGLLGVLVVGPKALGIVMALGTGNGRAAACAPGGEAVAVESLCLKQTVYGGATVWLIRAAGKVVPRFEIWSDALTIASILGELGESEAVALSAVTLEWLRLLEARPQYGVDIRDRDLPQETAQTHALHFAKGCYLGQEIVERIRSRGQVHRRFITFRLQGELPETLPAVLEAGGKAAGELTSAALVPLAEGAVLVGLGYARQEAVEAKLELRYGGGVAVPQRDPLAAG